MTTAVLGQAMNLVGGTITLTIPIGTQYFFIQNQDTQPIQMTVPGLIGGPILNPYVTQAVGFSGDWLDIPGFPFLPASITLTSVGPTPTATAQFAAWPSANPPTNFFPARDFRVIGL
jgi:hypothetical protein